MVTPTVLPYPLAKPFERAVVVLSCTRPKFFGRIGYALDPACLPTPIARLALEVAQTIFRESGHGPSSSLIVVQRLHSWMDEGRTSLAQVRAVVEMFDEAEDAGLPDEESTVSELTPIIQRRLRAAAVRSAMDAHGKQDDLSRAVELEGQASRIGITDTSVGVVVGDASFEDIAELRKLERLRTGILELDMGLDGGHQRGGLGMVVGGPGDGKSMFLSHQGGVSVSDGHVVACATLELPRAIWQARVIANLTGIPINAILADEASEKKAREVLASRKHLGAMIVQQFPEQGTTVADLKRWVADVEDHMRRKVTVLVVDYCDKLLAPPKKGKDQGSYEAGKEICESLRAIAVDGRMWVWTASQATRQKKPSKRLDMGDTADSMHKPRVADLWMSLNVSEEQQEITVFIGKHRTGRSRLSVGPLPTEFEVGRIAPIMESA